MAPLAIVDGMPHQPFPRQLWHTNNSTMGFGASCSDNPSGFDGVVRRYHVLAEHIEKKSLRTQVRKRRVCFSHTVQAKEIKNLDDMPREDVLSTWWTSDDYMMIRKMMALTVQVLSKGCKFDDNDKDFCERGLEFRSRSGAKQRNLNKRKAISAVLRAQEFQRHEGFSDPEYIAEIYSEYTRDCVEHSYSTGLSDEKMAFSATI